MILGIPFWIWGVMGGAGLVATANTVYNPETNQIKNAQDEFWDSFDYRTLLFIGIGGWFWKERNTRKNVSIRKGSKLSEARKFYSASKF